MKVLLDKLREKLILEGKAKKTINSYIACLNTISESIDIKNLTQDDINNYFLNLQAPDNTINQHKKALIKLIKAFDLGLEIPKFHKAVNPIPEYFDEDFFFEKLVPAIDNLFEDTIKVKCLFYVLFYTGLRVSEIVNLKKSDFDLKNLSIKIQNRKARNPIVVYYPKGMADLVEVQFDMHPEDEKIFEFTSNGVRYYCDILSENLEKHITPHTFRHSFAVNYLKRGGGSKNLQSLLGHRSGTSTAIYMQMTDKDREAEYRKTMQIIRRPKQ